MRAVPVEYIVDIFADVSSQSEEFSVDTMEDCLEEVSLSRILAVEEVKELEADVRPSYQVHTNRSYRISSALQRVSK